MKIAIVQLGSWGDNINSTLMYIPIKNKWPQCEIDVHTSTFYANAFANNPYVARVHEYAAHDKSATFALYNTVPNIVRSMSYDMVYVPHPIVNHDKWTSIKHGEFGTNLVCAWVRALEETDVDYEVPLTTILRLTPEERQNADHFIDKLEIGGARKILMEVHGESGQTQWDHVWTKDVCEHLLKDGTTHLFFSRKSPGPDTMALTAKYRGRVHFVGGLSLRECAQIFNRCDVFFSVSSGLANACHTDYCRKDVKWYEVVNSPACSTSVIRSEGKKFHHGSDVHEFIKLLEGDGV